MCKSIAEAESRMGKSPRSVVGRWKIGFFLLVVVAVGSGGRKKSRKSKNHFESGLDFNAFIHFMSRASLALCARKSNMRGKVRWIRKIICCSSPLRFAVANCRQMIRWRWRRLHISFTDEKKLSSSFCDRISHSARKKSREIHCRTRGKPPFKSWSVFALFPCCYLSLSAFCWWSELKVCIVNDCVALSGCGLCFEKRRLSIHRSCSCSHFHTNYPPSSHLVLFVFLISTKKIEDLINCCYRAAGKSPRFGTQTV